MNIRKKRGVHHFASSILIPASLAVALGLLAYNYLEKDEKLQYAHHKLQSAEALQVSMEEQYHHAITDVTLYKEHNDQLKQMIEDQNRKITHQASELEKLYDLKARFEEALIDKENFRAQVGYLENELRAQYEKIDSLLEENAILQADNDRLYDLYLTELIESELMEEEIEKLRTQIEILGRKLRMASVVDVINIQAGGVRVKNSGALVGEKKCDRVEKYQVCFAPNPNSFSSEKNDTFYIRIVNPIGETLAIERLGSGLIQPSDASDPVRYTAMVVANEEFEGERGEICFYWPAQNSSMPGEYQVEIFNNGYLAGRSTFKLH
ncbi:MAG: hypothetical protein KatS3mg029_0307 [Saprospiraceae bacterium]|nr:MAG: hypothetical protein KatS3mg029_0307 [Saprospiraceae bacterium]